MACDAMPTTEKASNNNGRCSYFKRTHGRAKQALSVFGKLMSLQGLRCLITDLQMAFGQAHGRAPSQFERARGKAKQVLRALETPKGFMVFDA